MQLYYLLISSSFATVLSLSCYNQTITIRETGDGATSSALTKLTCKRSCHITGQNVENAYVFRAYCDDEGRTEEGCYLRLDGSKHCSCYHNDCNLPNVERYIKEIYSFRNDKMIRHVGCLEYKGIIQGDRLDLQNFNGDIYTQKAECANSCHTYVYEDSDGTRRVEAGCMRFRPMANDEKDGCVIYGKTMDCFCRNEMCNDLRTQEYAVGLFKKRANMLSLQKPSTRRCATFTASITEATREITVQEQSSTICENNCVTQVGPLEKGIFGAEGFCATEQHLMRFLPIVVEDLQWIGFSMPKFNIHPTFIKEKIQNCTIISSHSIFAYCSCTENNCNKPDSYEIQQIMAHYKTRVST